LRYIEDPHIQLIPSQPPFEEDSEDPQYTLYSHDVGLHSNLATLVSI
jgi:hypothetical protein